MTPGLKTLREPPLLNPPGDADTWHGIPKELEELLHLSMKNNERDGQWHVFIANAADLKLFGATVDKGYVMAKESRMRRHILEFDTQSSGWFFLEQAFSMKRFGFDVSSETKQRKEVIRDYIREKLDEGNFFAFSRAAARMKEVEMKLDPNVGDLEPQIRGCVQDAIGKGDMKDLSHQLWAMDTLGLDVSSEVSAYGRGMMRALSESGKQKEWDKYVPLARYLLLLGITNEEGRQDQMTMPPVKRFGGVR